MRGNRKLIVAMTGMLGVIALCAFGRMDGGAAAGALGTIAVAFLGANAVVHRTGGGE
jgi:hypothetical protein